MHNFDRKAQQLKARVQFVRGTVRKAKGSTLTDVEADTMSDQAVSDEIDLGTLELVDREAEAPAAEGDGKAGDTGGEKAGDAGKAPAGKAGK